MLAALPGIGASAGTIGAEAGAESNGGMRPPPFYSEAFARVPTVAALTALGRALFRDPALSASGKKACISCHNPRDAFGPPDGRSVQRGGVSGRRPGVRAVPSLKYSQNVPTFTEHHFDDDGDDSVDQGPAGGRTWDGRAESAHDQARIALLSPFEMANSGIEQVVASVMHAGYAPSFRDAFGERVFDDKASAFRAVLLSLETYQQDPAEFYPYTSKYDAWLRHRVSLTGEELRGLEAFNDPARGNCARCHPSEVRQGSFPQFTDFGYAGIGIPRNSRLPANSDDRYYDLGLCGPWRVDLTDRPEYCGLFRVPSLRNVALRRVFFHNGVVHRLRDAVRFYAERDSRPDKWYSRGPDGRTRIFDDVPDAYQGNLDRAPPFGPAGERSPLSARDVEAIVVFLNTLTDGYPQ